MVVLEFFYRIFQENPCNHFLLNCVRTTLGTKSCHKKAHCALENVQLFGFRWTNRQACL
jgi:hypothetical protein